MPVAKAASILSSLVESVSGFEMSVDISQPRALSTIDDI